MPINVVGFLFGLIPFADDPAAASAPFTHERTLVGVSMLVAVATAYAFLELASLAPAHRRIGRTLWMAAAGAMLGAGIWATHFLGMLALESPVMRGYVLFPTALSAALAIACGAAAFLLTGPKPSWGTLALAALLLAIGSVAMHYLGMHGLVVDAALTYRPLPVAATSLGGFFGALVAFRLAHRVERSWLRAALAFPMGAVTAGLHYTDIAATVIAPRPAFAPPPPATPDALIAMILLGAVAALIALALWAVALDRRRAAVGEEAPEEGEHVIIIPTPRQTSDAIVHLPDRNVRRG